MHIAEVITEQSILGGIAPILIKLPCSICEYANNCIPPPLSNMPLVVHCPLYDIAQILISKSPADG